MSRHHRLRATGIVFAALVGMKISADAHREARNDGMDAIAERYVKLVLATGQHDTDYVDAYYGPPEWKPAADAPRPALDTLQQQADELVARLAPQKPADDEALALRHEYLTRQLVAVRARLRMLQGERLTFEEESRLLYDTVVPERPESFFASTLRDLETLMPGSGARAGRYEAFKARFVIPTDKVNAVFEAAIAECRARTRRYIDLPEAERFTLEYVSGKPWSGYNWYRGQSASLIQINTDLPIHIDRAIDLACHEGYPGHHVYNALLEHHLVRGRGWMEFTVYPLFSPQSLVAEGTANFGIAVAFPPRERWRFERDRLFPLAGLDQSRAREYYDVIDRVDRLKWADNEAARRYLNGAITREGAVSWLVNHGLTLRDRAEQRVRFIEKYRSYVINYNHGEELVRAYIESRGGTPDRPDRRWKEFAALLSSPRLPSGLN